MMLFYQLEIILVLTRLSKSSCDALSTGAGKLMHYVRSGFNAELTEKELFAWHSMLLSSQMHLSIGSWRTHEEPMQVISGALGKVRIHFEAPPSHVVESEMGGFIDWFNATSPHRSKPLKHAPVRAAITHLYIESIHPFED